MGRSFVGYIFVGPEEILGTHDQCVMAKEYLRKYRKIILDWNKKCEEAGDWLDPPKGYPKKLWENIDCYAMDLDQFVDMWDAIDPDVFLRELRDAWSGKMGNTLWRIVAKKKVVVVGDHTWGDTPDFPEYSLFETAEVIGLLDMLEVE